MIIPEGIRALYSDVIEKMHDHKVNKVAGATVTPESHEEEEYVEHSSTIGLSLVLGKFYLTILSVNWTIIDGLFMFIFQCFVFSFVIHGRSDIFLLRH